MCTTTLTNHPIHSLITPVAAIRSINVRLIDDTSIGISFDETTDMGTVAELCEVFGVANAEEVRTQSVQPEFSLDPKPSLNRSLPFLKPYVNLNSYFS